MSPQTLAFKAARGGTDISVKVTRRQSTGSSWAIVRDARATIGETAMAGTMYAQPEATPESRLDALRQAARGRASTMPAAAVVGPEELLEREGISAGMQLLQDETLDR
ncbi:MAG: hypothetical protein AB7I38_14515 [Dehalococcoidia bacterium]